MNKKFLLSLLNVGLIINATTYASAADLDEKSFEKAMDTYLNKEANVEKVSNSISTFFAKKREEQAKAANQAEDQRLEEQFKNPVKIDIGKSPVKGPKDAKVAVIAFSDFQCPYCSKGKSIMDDLVKMYPKDVKVVFKNLPLDFHPQAMPAAKAAHAAGIQGKFWEMHDLLFDNQKSLADSYYEEAAKTIGLDIEKFKKDFAAPETEEAVKADKELAGKLGVQGTPNFFVNGVNLRGAYPVEEFKKVIDKWLAKK